MKITVGKYTFDVVKKVPKGYRIWSLPVDTVPDYLLLCRKGKNTQRYAVDTTTLKGVYIGDKNVKVGLSKISQIVSNATPSKVVTYIRRYEKTACEATAKKVAFLKEIMPYMCQIWGEVDEC